MRITARADAQRRHTDHGVDLSFQNTASPGAPVTGRPVAGAPGLGGDIACRSNFFIESECPAGRCRDNLIRAVLLPEARPKVLPCEEFRCSCCACPPVPSLPKTRNRPWSPNP